jgi:hypothetical protein
MITMRRWRWGSIDQSNLPANNSSRWCHALGLICSHSTAWSFASLKGKWREGRAGERREEERRGGKKRGEERRSKSQTSRLDTIPLFRARSVTNTNTDKERQGKAWQMKATHDKAWRVMRRRGEELEEKTKHSGHRMQHIQGPVGRPLQNCSTNTYLTNILFCFMNWVVSLVLLIVLVHSRAGTSCENVCVLVCAWVWVCLCVSVCVCVCVRREGGRESWEAILLNRYLISLIKNDSSPHKH